MKLNRLPVLIRTEVTAAAAKGVNLPAVYSRALAVLEEAVNELSFAKLKTIEVSIEGLAAWAKATQDEKMTKTTRELKFRSRRTASYIAEQLVKRRKAAFIASGNPRTHNGGIPSTVRGSVESVLKEVGYNTAERQVINAAGRAPDNAYFAQLSAKQLQLAVRGTGRRPCKVSDVYRTTFSDNTTPLRNDSWFRRNNARGIARRLTTPTEITKARQRVVLIHAWCEEFLKNLPRTVSKAK